MERAADSLDPALREGVEHAMEKSMTRISMRFDLRIPPFAKTSFADQHRAMLEMVTWADRVGVETVILSEHHGDPAGFSCAPITLAAAVL